MTGASTSAKKEMDGWRVWSDAVPEDEPWVVETVAELMGVSVDTVYRWKRRPLTAETPEANGRRNPIDYFGRMVCALYSANPDGAELVFDWVDHLRAALRAKHGRAPAIRAERIETELRQMGRRAAEMADAIVGLNGDKKQ